jgi:hypothetical protein
MPQFDVAHIREQGQDMVIVPLERSFGQRSSTQQNSMLRQIEIAARGAGLAGHAVLVWETSGGRMGFLAPPAWQSFFRNKSLQWVASNVNRSLSW